MRLFATVKANGLDPYGWLTDVVTGPSTILDKPVDSMLPASWYCPIRWVAAAAQDDGADTYGDSSSKH
jgi:hypothetical protein